MILANTAGAKSKSPTFESRMEKKASCSNDQVSDKGDQEDILMPLTPAIENTLDT
jgi:hypothetical protein